MMSALPPPSDIRDALELCPFCGGKVYDSNVNYTFCHGCNAVAPRAVWNRRTLTSSPPDIRDGKLREAQIEECAKVADGYAKSAETLLVSNARYGAHSAAIGIAGKIRALSSSVRDAGEKKD